MDSLVLSVLGQLSHQEIHETAKDTVKRPGDDLPDSGHLYGYQLAHGVIPRLGWGTDSPTVCHTCDSHSCQRPTHLRLGTPAENRAEWLTRRRDPGSPLADLRGPAHRARAIGAAIRTGRALGEDEAEIIRRIEAAAAAGRPLSLW
ncbi:hypothetical protein AB0C97_27390 [Streptomyces goshikiensis]|uniref:hypothetical protein n=1 Tax=Streptomyces goshikiensis TaxID=1942 RepID=UPI0033ECDA53